MDPSSVADLSRLVDQNRRWSVPLVLVQGDVPPVDISPVLSPPFVTPHEATGADGAALFCQPDKYPNGFPFRLTYTEEMADNGIERRIELANGAKPKRTQKVKSYGGLSVVVHSTSLEDFRSAVDGGSAPSVAKKTQQIVSMRRKCVAHIDTIAKHSTEEEMKEVVLKLSEMQDEAIARSAERCEAEPRKKCGKSSLLSCCVPNETKKIQRKHYQTDMG